MNIRRSNWKIIVNPDDPRERWSFDDTRSARMAEAHERLYHDDAHFELGDARVLDSVTGTLDYLLYTCPSTKDACAKLREMRRAVRALAASTPATPTTEETP